MKLVLNTLILIFCFAICHSQVNKATQLLQEMVTAMGGIEKYRQLDDVTYDLTYRDMISGKQDVTTEKYLYDGELSWATYHVHTKNVATDKEGPVIQAWNGKDTWIIVGGNFVPAPPVLRMTEFGRKTAFFWLNMMYKLLDPGTIHKALADRTFDNKTYQVVQVTYADNIGDAQDKFVLYINPDSKLVEHFIFSNTFMGPKVPPRMMHVEFQEVGGLKFPKRQWYETVDWEGNLVAGGPPKSEKLYKNIVLNSGIEKSLFDKPMLTNIPMADLRNELLKQGITPENTQKGKDLLAKMETACGGYETWKGYNTGSFKQTADWYDNETNWTINPQEYSMTSVLGHTDGTLTLLNGPRAGSSWTIKDEKVSITKGEAQPGDVKMIWHKQAYKTYWFQFPFKIREAEIIAYGGQREIKGVNYDVVFATWHSEKPNSKYDQYMLYLHPETHLLEWLEFTVRDVFPMATAVSQFTNYQENAGLRLPMSQFITTGTLDKPMKKLHENHYQEISFK